MTDRARRDARARRGSSRARIWRSSSARARRSCRRSSSRCSRIAIFYFTWDESIVTAADRAPGVLWVVLTFSALLGLQRSFGLEEHDRGIDALLVSPISRESIYLGKAIGNLIFLSADAGRRDSGARAVLQSSTRPADAASCPGSCSWR